MKPIHVPTSYLGFKFDLFVIDVYMRLLHNSLPSIMTTSWYEKVNLKNNIPHL